MDLAEEPPVRMAREVVAYENRYVTVFDDAVERSDGSAGTHLRIVEAGDGPGAAVLALHRDQVALVRVFRYPLGRWEWGIPRGSAHGPDPEVTARAELAEELGGAPDELERLGSIAPNSGLLASEVALFLARYRVPIAAPTDLLEVAEVRWRSLDQIEGSIRSGEITDGFTLAALAIARAQGHLPTRTRPDDRPKELP